MYRSIVFSDRWLGFVQFRIILNVEPMHLTLSFAMSAPTTTPHSATNPQPPSGKLGLLKKARTAILKHVRHLGVGIVCAVAYFDP